MTRDLVAAVDALVTEIEGDDPRRSIGHVIRWCRQHSTELQQLRDRYERQPGADLRTLERSLAATIDNWITDGQQWALHREIAEWAGRLFGYAGLAPLVASLAVDRPRVADLVRRDYLGIETQVTAGEVVPLNVRTVAKGEARRPNPRSVQHHQPGRLRYLQLVEPTGGLRCVVDGRFSEALDALEAIGIHPATLHPWMPGEVVAGLFDAASSTLHAPLRVGLVGPKSDPGERLRSLIAGACRTGANVIVGPELCLLPTSDVVALLGGQSPVVAALGSAHLSADEGTVNEAQILIDGVSVHTHRKVNPMFILGVDDNEWREDIRRGDSVRVFIGRTTHLMVVICADLNDASVRTAVTSLAVNLLLVLSMSPTIAVYEGVAHEVLLTTQGMTVVANQWLSEFHRGNPVMHSMIASAVLDPFVAEAVLAPAFKCG